MRRTLSGCVAMALVLALASPAQLPATGGADPDQATTGENQDTKMNTSSEVTVDSPSAMGALKRMRAGGTQGQGAVEVTAENELAVRSAMKFGDTVIGSINKGQKFKVKGRNLGWFEIEFTQSPAYVYITTVKAPGGDSFQPDPTASNNQTKVKQAAYNVMNKRPFPYDPATNGGVLGCAQVVSTALKAAGVMSQVMLGVLGVIDDLKKKGWRLVQAPPWKDSDVVTWKTYDRDKDGSKDEDTHIGIVVKENGTNYAMNNSSSNRRPEKHLLSTYYAPVSHVLRMPGV